jgi:hypothetical protein
MEGTLIFMLILAPISMFAVFLYIHLSGCSELAVTQVLCALNEDLKPFEAEAHRLEQYVQTIQKRLDAANDWLQANPEDPRRADVVAVVQNLESELRMLAAQKFHVLTQKQGLIGQATATIRQVQAQHSANVASFMATLNHCNQSTATATMNTFEHSTACSDAMFTMACDTLRQSTDATGVI